MRVTLYGQQYRIGFRYDPLSPTVTDAFLLDEAGVVFAGGRAWCHENDNFCKETGRKLALTRAVKDLPKEQRKAVWEAYLNRKVLADPEGGKRDTGASAAGEPK